MSHTVYEPWTGAMITMLRVLIDDNAYQGSYVYSDPRLREILTVAAMYVTQEIQFKTDYKIDVMNCSITPDPYTENDKVFQNMVVMKSACIIDHGHFRQKAFTSGLEAKCGPATMKTLNQSAGFKDLIMLGPCGIYEKLKEEHNFSGQNLSELVHFALTPFTHDDFDPVYAFQSYNDTDRMV